MVSRLCPEGLYNSIRIRTFGNSVEIRPKRVCSALLNPAHGDVRHLPSLLTITCNFVSLLTVSSAHTKTERNEICKLVLSSADLSSAQACSRAENKQKNRALFSLSLSLSVCLSLSLSLSRSLFLSLTVSVFLTHTHFLSHFLSDTLSLCLSVSRTHAFCLFSLLSL